jgi:hypothetical protein
MLVPLALVVGAAAMVLGAAVAPILGTTVALAGAACLYVLRRIYATDEPGAPSSARPGVTERQSASLPEWHVDRDIFPVPTWAWLGVAVLIYVPLGLGQVHVLSQDHAGSWLVVGFVISGFLLFASGRYERARMRKRADAG